MLPSLKNVLPYGPSFEIGRIHLALKWRSWIQLSSRFLFPDRIELHSESNTSTERRSPLLCSIFPSKNKIRPSRKPRFWDSPRSNGICLEKQVIWVYFLTWPLARCVCALGQVMQTLCLSFQACKMGQ